MPLPTTQDVTAYLQKTSLESVMQTALNQAIQRRPEDVAAFLAKHFDEVSKKKP